PAVGGVRDDYYPLSVPSGGEIAQEGAHRRHDLAVTLTTGEGLVDAPAAFGREPGGGHPVQLAVVALAQPRVLPDRDAAAGEGQLRRLYRPRQIGDEYDVRPIGAASLTQRSRQLAAACGEPSRQPAGGDAGLVVGADRVRLEDDLDGHRSPSAGWPGRR